MRATYTVSHLDSTLEKIGCVLFGIMDLGTPLYGGQRLTFHVAVLVTSPCHGCTAPSLRTEMQTYWGWPAEKTKKAASIVPDNGSVINEFAARFPGQRLPFYLSTTLATIRPPSLTSGFPFSGRGLS